MVRRYGLLTWLVTKYTDVREHRSLLLFGRLLDDPYLFHLNERSVPRAFAIGLFFAWVPVPFQMILAATGAILFRANVPLSVLLVWITNPLTIPPMFYFAYMVGTWLTGEVAHVFEFQLSMEWLVAELETIGKPLLVGCGVAGSISSIIGYMAMRLYWNARLSRYITIKVARHQRHRRRHRDMIKKGSRGHHRKKH